MSYVERLCAGEFTIDRRNKKKRILGTWFLSPGHEQEYSASFEGKKNTIDTIMGFFRINSSKRLKIFIDDGDETFERKKDDPLTSYKMNRRELKSFNQTDSGSFEIEYISWHIPPDLCKQSQCYGDYYRVLMSPNISEIYISAIIDSTNGKSLRDNCILWDVQ